jgi:hypothetical protein
MSKNAPPPQNIGLFGQITQQLLARETALKEGLVPKEPELVALSRRISDGAKRTFGYDKDALGASYINALKESLPPSTALKLSGRPLSALYGAALEQMELYYRNGAGAGRRSVFDDGYSQPQKKFKDLWGDGRSSFQETLNGLKDSESAPLFDETAVRTAVSKLREYCKEQFVRGYSQGKGEAIWSPENFCQVIARLIPDRTQG